METREPSCMPRVAKHFFIPMVHSPSGAVDTWQHRSSPLRKAEPRAMVKKLIDIDERTHYAPFYFVFILGNKLQLQDRSKDIFHFCQRYFRL
jgi:hypothetical protein